MFPSVSFIDDEVTSQQVLQYWKCSTRERELCAEHRFCQPRRICDRSTFAKIMYEEVNEAEEETKMMNKVKIVQ